MSAWKTDSQETGASSPPSSNATRSSWCALLVGRSPRSLGSWASTTRRLGNWVRQDRIDRGDQAGLSSDERARLRELQRENTKLRMERDLLKRTVAFWVKETSTPCAATAVSTPRRPPASR
jgi:hypothetical protein